MTSKSRMGTCDYAEHFGFGPRHHNILGKEHSALKHVDHSNIIEVAGGDHT